MRSLAEILNRQEDQHTLLEARQEYQLKPHYRNYKRLCDIAYQYCYHGLISTDEYNVVTELA